jgi:SAM-dependent methyltransferase
MAGLRSRGGIVVRTIEERRKDLVAARVRRVLTLVPSGPCSGVVADVGCEDGWIAQAYAAHAGETILVDVDPAVLGRATAIPRCRTVVADAATRDAVPRASVDVVVLSAILEHVVDPGAVLAAWAPALREGGRFVVYVPADRPILALKRVLRVARLAFLVRGVSLDPAPGHVRTFSRRSLVRLLKPFGVLEEVEFDPAVLGYAATVRVTPPDDRPAVHGGAAPETGG